MEIIISIILICISCNLERVGDKISKVEQQLTKLYEIKCAIDNAGNKIAKELRGKDENN